MKRCRKEITFYEQIKDVEKKDAARFMARIASAELEEDAVKRVGLAHQVMRGLRGPQEKLAYVAVDDDPDKGRVRTCRGQEISCKHRATSAKRLQKRRCGT